jgi:hypothetical protein
VDEYFHVALLLPNGHGRRVLPRGCQVRAIGRTRNLHEPLRPAADGANLLTEGGTSSSGAPCLTQRTDHVAQYCIIRLKNTQNSSERRLQLPVVYVTVRHSPMAYE